MHDLGGLERLMSVRQSGSSLFRALKLSDVSQVSLRCLSGVYQQSLRCLLAVSQQSLRSQESLRRLILWEHKILRLVGIEFR